MPNPKRRRGSGEEPDMRDVRTLCEEIEQQFKLLLRFEVKITSEDVEMVCRAVRPTAFNGNVLECQALARRRLSDRRPIEQMFYSVAWDVFQQLDTGILGFGGRYNS